MPPSNTNRNKLMSNENWGSTLESMVAAESARIRTKKEVQAAKEIESIADTKEVWKVISNVLTQLHNTYPQHVSEMVVRTGHHPQFQIGELWFEFETNQQGSLFKISDGYGNGNRYTARTLLNPERVRLPVTVEHIEDLIPIILKIVTLEIAA